MKKTFCDRCGKVMENAVMLDMTQAAQLLAGTRYILTSRYGMGETKMYDLCPECQSDLYDWLNGEPDKKEEK